jgi:hypothetical protein
MNNPLKFIDPTGHRAMFADHNPLWSYVSESEAEQSWFMDMLTYRAMVDRKWAAEQGVKIDGNGRLVLTKQPNTLQVSKKKRVANQLEGYYKDSGQTGTSA